MPSLQKLFQETVLDEFVEAYRVVRNQKYTLGLFFAIFCVLIVILGNVTWLIALNFWMTVFPQESAEHNSMQIAVQVVTLLVIEVIFTSFAVGFVGFFGFREIWKTLRDKDRMRGPLYRFVVLILSGVLNGSSSVLQIYALTHTPMLLQAIFLCTIPLSAQVCTLLFIPEERQREYLSFFFVASLILLVLGILLPSASAFENGTAADAHGPTWSWALINLLSCVIFGLWCVTQRLYLDALIEKDSKSGGEANESVRAGLAQASTRPLPTQHTEAEKEKEHEQEPEQEQEQKREEKENFTTAGRPTAKTVNSIIDSMDEPPVLIAEKRSWAHQNVRQNSAKLVLLVGSIFFQIVYILLLIPIDAIPWFGTSSSVSEAAKGFTNSFRFIFASWYNFKYGLLNAIGILMSYIGCVYLNEESPTLASVVLQMAAPLTSVVIIVIPQWNVYKDNAQVGYKVTGVILLFISAFMYHMWEQRSLRILIARAHANKPTLNESTRNTLGT